MQKTIKLKGLPRLVKYPKDRILILKWWKDIKSIMELQVRRKYRKVGDDYWGEDYLLDNDLVELINQAYDVGKKDGKNEKIKELKDVLTEEKLDGE